jgi:chromosome segregation ATPase
MSTSPSWFDQEKFSRLVKKVGPKPATEALPLPPGAEPDTRAISGGGLAPTSRISLVSKPPSLLSEHRALPALPRRTTPLPALKALFQYPTQPRHSPPPGQPSTGAANSASTETFPAGEETGAPTEVTRDADVNAPFSQEGDDLAAIWQKMGQLNEELAHTVRERDQAIEEGVLLREQLRQADETHEGREGAAAPTEEFARAARERDEALAEAQSLREQLRQAQEAVKGRETPAQDSELSLVTEERDRARREYAALRKQFETLKQEQNPKEESGKFRKELEQQVDGFRQKLEERNLEIAALRANPGGSGDGDEKLKQEVVSLREEITRLKVEASVAQRGLALSQKALHETRDTLREATEGTSLSRHNFDNLKNECATLAQQNTVLQAQHDQLARDLADAKSKLTKRL